VTYPEKMYAEPNLDKVQLFTSQAVSDESLNALFSSAWNGHTDRQFEATLSRSLLYVCAYVDQLLVGFVNVAWDGGQHAFILDTCVHKNYQRRGIGKTLVCQAIADTSLHSSVQWLHVDFEPHLQTFYASCGFRASAAGVLQLRAI
jgi:ribosomal protein S18 acetylase RimI-like enzyme